MTHPVPAGLLSDAAIDGKLLNGTVAAAGQVFLDPAIGHGTGTVLGQWQVGDKRGDGIRHRVLLGGLEVAAWS